MNKQTLFRLLAVFAVILLPFLTASPVQAGAPIPTKEVFDDYYPVENDCGFEITGHLYGRLDSSYFLYDNGLKNKILVHAPTLKGTWSANGKELNFQVSGPVQYRQTNEGFLQIMLGTWDFLTVPGYGAVWGFAGHVILEWQFIGVENGQEIYEMVAVLKEVGNFTPYDWAPICAYFSEG